MAWDDKRFVGRNYYEDEFYFENRNKFEVMLSPTPIKKDPYKHIKKLCRGYMENKFYYDSPELKEKIEQVMFKQVESGYITTDNYKEFLNNNIPLLKEQYKQYRNQGITINEIEERYDPLTNQNERIERIVTVTGDSISKKYVLQKNRTVTDMNENIYEVNAR